MLLGVFLRVTTMEARARHPLESAVVPSSEWEARACGGPRDFFNSTISSTANGCVTPNGDRSGGQRTSHNRLVTFYYRRMTLRIGRSTCTSPFTRCHKPVQSWVESRAIGYESSRTLRDMDVCCSFYPGRKSVILPARRVALPYG